MQLRPRKRLETCGNSIHPRLLVFLLFLAFSYGISSNTWKLSATTKVYPQGILGILPANWQVSRNRLHLHIEIGLLKLTNLTLKNLRSNGARREVSISGLPGLRVRVSGTGDGKTWVYVYRRGGDLKRLTIGSADEYSIAEVTEMHGRLRRLALDGDDPAKALPEQRALQRKATGLTIQALAEDYRDRYLKTEIDTADEIWRLLEKDVLPLWADRQVDTIEAYDLSQLLDGIVDRGAVRVAERVRSTVRQMFVHGNKRGLTKSFPFSAMGPITSKKQKRSKGRSGRALQDAEIKVFWEDLESAKMLPRLKPAFKLLLLTGQRRAEVAKAPWHLFDLKAKVWKLESGDNKSRRVHVIPLSPFAIEALEELKALLNVARSHRHKPIPYTGPWLFPSPHWDQDGHIDPHALTRAISNNAKHWGIPHFTPHDMRRTVRSGLAAMKVDRDVARRILNHKLEGMDEIYNEYEYLDEKREALDQWGEKVRSLVSA